MAADLLRIATPDELPQARRGAVDRETLDLARLIVDDVREHGEAALRRHAERLGDIGPGDPLVIPAGRLNEALAALDPGSRAVLERTADRIRIFAAAQLASLGETETPLPGGWAGQVVAPVERAGCYAPGGRFPLPSSVLMTAVTARVAGVTEVWVASPRPAPVTLAAAALAGADGLLAAGGAQAIAALAYGAGPIPRCDMVAGPGNRFVTAAKQLVAGYVGIDMLAGPSELVVLADGTADPSWIAADLLAQAEHDPDALPILVTTDRALAGSVNAELERQITDLPTARTARAALANGLAVLAPDIESAIGICDRLAPEHLELHTRDAAEIAPRFSHYGAIFIGARAAEVLGDYGAGPNHTLPTGGTARYKGGLSVFDFLRVRTWLRIDDSGQAAVLIEDAGRMAEIEGLVAHARAARLRARTLS
jgi:phosphoribosyl-ATP pyrophosphohydrolase/phosphoribosyl-AMP cyclohydrolase/histidinol dehydrogenase